MKYTPPFTVVEKPGFALVVDSEGHVLASVPQTSAKVQPVISYAASLEAKNKQLENALRILTKRSKRLMDFLYDDRWDGPSQSLYAEPVDAAIKLAEAALK